MVAGRSHACHQPTCLVQPAIARKSHSKAVQAGPEARSVRSKLHSKLTFPLVPRNPGEDQEVLEYLEDVFPTPSLRPADPEHLARARLFLRLAIPAIPKGLPA